LQTSGKPLAAPSLELMTVRALMLAIVVAGLLAWFLIGH
jgi:hypothetical protein